jgi:D-aspartate ligase
VTATRHAAAAVAGAIVIGADYRGLAVVRSLGRRGIPVWVLRDGDDTLARASRYTTRHLDLPAGDDATQAAFLVGLADQHGLAGWTLFPTSNRTTRMVATNRDRLAEHYTLTTPAWSVVAVAYDKRDTIRLAATLGIDQPRTWYATTGAQAAALDVRYPVCVKPAISQVTTQKAWRADTPAQLADRFDHAATLIDPTLLLIQELVPGGGQQQFSYAALCDDGVSVAHVVAQRTRQYPADFGRASTYVETTDEPQVQDAAERILREIGYTGLVEVEFKRDPRDGTLKLLDINPRVWGWHSLCQRAGVDFPYLAMRLARHQPVPATRVTVGVRWSRLTTDLPTSIREMLAGRLAVGTYLASWRGPRESAIFARDDPWPGMVEFPMLVSVVGRRLIRGHGV